MLMRPLSIAAIFVLSPRGCREQERPRLGFWHSASLPDPRGLYNARLEGSKSRAVDSREGDDLREDPLPALIRAGVEFDLTKVRPARTKKQRCGILVVLPRDSIAA